MTDYETCSQHGQQEIVDEGSYTGYAGGGCWYATLACGCTLNDDSNDVEAAR